MSDDEAARKLRNIKLIADLERAEAALRASGNYVADREQAPTEVTFANGRIVRAIGGTLEVGWSDSIFRAG